MISKEIIKWSLVAGLAAVPFHAQARSGEEALDACAAAMVSQLAADQGAPMVYNLDPESPGLTKSRSRLDIIHLDAKDPESHEVVARADCVVDRKAHVKKLIRVPLDAPDAAMRATHLD